MEVVASRVDELGKSKIVPLPPQPATTYAIHITAERAVEASEKEGRNGVPRLGHEAVQRYRATEKRRQRESMFGQGTEKKGKRSRVGT